MTGGPTAGGQITAITRVGQFIFAIDAEHQRLARTPAAKPCDPVALEMPPAPRNALARLGPDQLLISGGGTVQAFRVDASGNRQAALANEGFRPRARQQQQHDEVYVAASGA